MKLTIREKILLHLAKVLENEKEERGSFYVSQKGIAESIGGSLSQVSRVLRKMIDEGLVKEKRRYLEPDHKRKKKTYYLTLKGKEREKQLRENLMEKEITICTEEGKKNIKLAELNGYIEDENPILYASINISSNGILNLTKEKKKKKFTFVNRETELNKLKDELEKVEDGCSIIFLIGRAGTGKTALALKFKEYAEEKGFSFLHGKAYYETSDPYLPFKKAFENHEAFENEFFPLPKFGLNSSSKRSVNDQESLEAERRLAFFEFTNELRKLAKEKPLVIFLDDLQWADKATLQLLHYMVDNLSDSPILFLTAYRSESITENHSIKDLSSRLSREKHYEELLIEPLERDYTRQMLNSRMDLTKVPEDFVELIHSITEGNPLFVKEFIELLENEEELPTYTSDYPTEGDDVPIPRGIEEVFKRRLNLYLSEKAKRIAEIGSIIGDQFPFDLIQKCTDMDELELCEIIDELLKRGVWEEIPEEDSFTFNHGLMSTIIYEDISEAKKKRMHKIVAEKMEELREDRIEEYHSDLGYHYKKAKKTEKAIEQYKKAGERAEKVYAHEDAIEMYEQALDLVDEEEKKIDLLQRIGSVRKILGEYDSSIEKFEDVLQISSDKQQRKRALAGLSEIFLNKGNLEKALHKAEEGLSIEEDEESKKLTCKLLAVKGSVQVIKGEYEKAKKVFSKEKKIAENINDEREIAQALHKLGSVNLTEGNYDTALESLNKAVNIREKMNDRIGLSKSLNNIGLIFNKKGEYEKALEFFKRTQKIKEETGDKAGTMKTLNNIGVVYNNRGNFKKALDCYERSLEIGEEIGDQFGLAKTYVNIGTIYYEAKNNFDKALEYLTKGYEIEEEIENLPGMASALNNMGVIYQEKGEFDRAFENHEESLRIGEKINDKGVICSSLYNMAFIYSRKGELDIALNHYEESREFCEEIENKRLALHVECGLAQVYLKLGEEEKAFSHGEKALTICQHLKAKKEKGMVHKILGKIYCESKKFDESIIEFKKALSVLEELEDEVEYHKVIYEQGVMFKKKGELSRAANKLKIALEYFNENDLEWWAQKCQEELEEID